MKKLGGGTLQIFVSTSLRNNPPAGPATMPTIQSLLADLPPSVPPLPPADDDVAAPANGNDVADANNNEEVDAATTTTNNAVRKSPRSANGSSTSPKRRNKKLPLTPHEAVTQYWNRGIYTDNVTGDTETGELRCSCNHKCCDKWDAYGYSRHFTFKCHLKYVNEQLDEVEMTRLKVARDTFLSINPGGDNNDIHHVRKRHRKISGGGVCEQPAPMTVEECRIQEIHWMEMWKDANAQLKQLRAELKDEANDVVRAELLVDIEGLKKRKGDMAKLLGMTNDVGGDE